MSAEGPKHRDREQTKQKLVDAAIAIIKERGFGEVGVNAVSERAGVSKVLIYRYFGSLEGLFRAVADELDPLQSQAAHRMFSELDPEADLARILQRTIVELHNALKGDELTKNLLTWELSNQNAITEVLSAARERTGLELTEQVRTALSRRSGGEDLDIHALFAIVTAGVFYLTLRSDSVETFNGVDITTEEGWERIAAAVAGLLKQ